ncbi:hypothetical protein SESBI_20768 [Sesbania bispinosa]|nr:hypothetical protein SESBI_20768 [Sesbania bispinosa]
MAKGISKGVDCANRDHMLTSESELCTSFSNYSNFVPSLAYYNNKSVVRRKSHYHQHKAMGDIFYGNDDYEEIKNHMYKEDVMECMRREEQFKAFKRRQKRRWSFSFFGCFEFLRLFLCCGTSD